MALEYINCAWFIVLLNQFYDNLHWHKLIFCQQKMENWVLAKLQDKYVRKNRGLRNL